MKYIEKLNALRVAKNLSFRQLGFICELSDSSVKKILYEECVPLITSIEKLCTALGTSLPDLFCGADELILKNSAETVALVSACVSLSPEAQSHLSWIANKLY